MRVNGFNVAIGLMFLLLGLGMICQGRQAWKRNEIISPSRGGKHGPMSAGQAIFGGVCFSSSGVVMIVLAARRKKRDSPL